MTKKATIVGAPTISSLKLALMIALAGLQISNKPNTKRTKESDFEAIEKAKAKRLRKQQRNLK